jgi:hypothetical protein
MGPKDKDKILKFRIRPIKPKRGSVRTALVDRDEPPSPSKGAPQIIEKNILKSPGVCPGNLGKLIPEVPEPPDKSRKLIHSKCPGQRLWKLFRSKAQNPVPVMEGKRGERRSEA